MHVVGFSFQGLIEGYYYCSLMALSWDPVMIFLPDDIHSEALNGELVTSE